MKAKSTLATLLYLYLAIFGLVMLAYHATAPVVPMGEWDDYTMPIASILHDQNLSISSGDKAFYRQIYPEWAKYVKWSRLSVYKARGGNGELAWYFPTYGIACMPLTGLLKMLNLRTVLAFPLTNLGFLLLALFFTCGCLKVGGRRKIVITLLLTLNPVVFYIGWSSAEVFIYSMLVMGMTAWYNGWRRIAATFVAVAGTLNPVILSVGIVMVVEYAVRLFREKDRGQNWRGYLKGRLPELLKYGCCYIVGVIPMAFNLYHVGHVNLTASVKRFTHGGAESTWSRFVAYLFDFNYGFLPYFPIPLCIGVVMACIAISRRKYKYFVWLGAFLANVALYSIMIHINSGMSGIARYNAWNSAILIFAVAVVGLDMVNGRKATNACLLTLGFGALLAGAVVFAYGPRMAINTSYTSFTPIAEWVLDHAPWLYNPLPSTFNSRTTHQDGGYDVKTPVVYCAKDGNVRKILAAGKDKSSVKDKSIFTNGPAKDFFRKVDNLEAMSFISVDGEEGMAFAPEYSLGSGIGFSTASPRGLAYVSRGINLPEDWGTWSEGDTVAMQMRINAKCPLLHADIEAIAYGKGQAVAIYANSAKVYENPDYKGDGIHFDFDNPGVGKPLTLRFVLPDSISALRLGYPDWRKRALGFIQLTIAESAKPASKPSGQDHERD